MSANEIVGLAFAIMGATALTCVTVLLIFGTYIVIKIGLKKG